jgi:hypothetical protein
MDLLLEHADSAMRSNKARKMLPPRQTARAASLGLA